MADQADEIVGRGIKLAFAKRKHLRAASEWWIKGSGRGSRRAIRLLARVMLNDIYGGRKEQRPIVLAALKSASILNSQYERIYLLFALYTAPIPGIKDPLIRLAQSGDVVASLALARIMHNARASRDYEYLVQTYGLLVQTFVRSRNVIAAWLIGLELRDDGRLRAALSLLIWAGNRGDFASLAHATVVAHVLGFAMIAADSERDSAFALARHKTFACRDPGAAHWLRLCFTEPRWGHVLDIVASIRMLRLACLVDMRGIVRLVFGGESLWNHFIVNKGAGFDLLYEEQKLSDQLFHFTLVHLLGATRSALGGWPG